MFERIGAGFQGTPAAVQYFIDTAGTTAAVSVFARLDDASYGHRAFVMRDSEFGSLIAGDDWQRLGGVFSGDLAPAASSAVRVFGRGTDHSLWVIWSNGTSWFGPERVGGEFSSAISAVDSSRAGSHVFVRGKNGAVWHYFYDGGSHAVNQMALEDLGGEIRANPAAVATPERIIYVFVRGLDDRLWRLTFDGTRWTGWRPLGVAGFLDPLADPMPVIVTVPPSSDWNMFVFDVGSDKRLRYVSISPADRFYSARADELTDAVEPTRVPQRQATPTAASMCSPPEQRPATCSIPMQASPSQDSAASMRGHHSADRSSVVRSRRRWRSSQRLCPWRGRSLASLVRRTELGVRSSG